MKKIVPKAIVVTMATIALGLGIVGIDPQESKGATHYYRASWVWYCDGKKDNIADDCYWRAPGDGSLGAVDLRSIPQSSQLGGTPQGTGVFAYDKEQKIDGAEYLGTDKEAVAEFVWTKLTTESDPTGQTAPKPIQGSLGSEIELYLGGEKMKSEPMTLEHKERTIAVFQSDYARNVAEYPKQVLQKWVGATMEEVYGEKNDTNAKKLVPTRYKNKKKLWLPPETVIGDTFTDTDSTDLASHTASGSGGGWSWTEITSSDNMMITSNAARPTTSGTNDDRDYRAESDLSTDDMYAFATIGTSGSSFDGGIEARFSASVRTHYQVEYGNTFFRIARTVAGARTVMQETNSLSHSAGDKVEIRVNGSTVQAFRNGTQLGTDVTDTNITGHLRTGINTWHGKTTWDTFEAGDITVGGGSVYTDPPKAVWFE